MQRTRAENGENTDQGRKRSKNKRGQKRGIKQTRADNRDETNEGCDPSWILVLKHIKTNKNIETLGLMWSRCRPAISWCPAQLEAANVAKEAAAELAPKVFPEVAPKVDLQEAAGNPGGSVRSSPEGISRGRPGVSPELALHQWQLHPFPGHSREAPQSRT
jgi:hypothetical protein